MKEVKYTVKYSSTEGQRRFVTTTTVTVVDPPRDFDDLQSVIYMKITMANPRATGIIITDIKVFKE
jgi:hypothetical protein